MAVDLSVFDEPTNEVEPTSPGNTAAPAALDLSVFDSQESEPVAGASADEDSAPPAETVSNSPAPTPQQEAESKDSGLDLSAYDQAVAPPEVPLHAHPFVVNTLSDPNLNDDQRQELITTYGQSYQGAYGADTDAVDSFKMHLENAWDNYNTLGSTLRKENVGTGRIDERAGRISAIEKELKKRETMGLNRKKGDEVNRMKVIGNRIKAMLTGDRELGRQAFTADRSDETLRGETVELRAELDELREGRYESLLDEARKQAKFAALDSEGLLENAAAVAGSLGGAIVDPINLIPVAKPVQGTALATRMGAKGAQFGAINAAVNPTLQDTAIDANQQEGFEWTQFAADTGLGFLAGAGFEGLGDVAKKLLKSKPKQAPAKPKAGADAPAEPAAASEAVGWNRILKEAEDMGRPIEGDEAVVAQQRYVENLEEYLNRPAELKRAEVAIAEKSPVELADGTKAQVSQINRETGRASVWVEADQAYRDVPIDEVKFTEADKLDSAINDREALARNDLKALAPERAAAGPEAGGIPPEGQQQRGFSERLKRDENFDEAEIASNPAEYYEPQVNARGEDVVARMDDAELRDTFMDMNPDAPSGQNWSTLAGIERLRRAVANGEDTKAIREELSKRGTSLGQAIQQYSAWKTATPEGLLAVVEDAANARGRKLQQVSKDRGMDMAKRRLQAQERLRQAEARHLREFTDETADAYQKARKQAADAARDFDKFTRDMLPPEFWRTMSTTLKGNLLTSESLLINLLGNALYYPVRKVKGGVANAMDAIWSLASGTRTHAEGVAKTRGEIVGAKEGLERGLQALRFGGTLDDYLKAEVQHGFRPVRAMLQAFAPSEKGLMPVKEGSGKVAMSDRARKLVEGLVGAPPETMFRLLQLGDQPFRGSAYRGAVEELATIKKLSGKEREKFILHPDEVSRSLAQERGNAAVFMKDGAVGKMLKQIDEQVGKIPVIGKPAQFFGTLVMPYRQFPINFVMEAVDYALPAVSIGKSLVAASRGNQRDATELMAKAVTGLTLYSAAGYLYEKGIITPSVDYRDRKLKQLSYNFKQPPGTLNVSGIKRLMKGEDPSYQEGDKVMNYEKTGIAGIAMHLESQSRWKRKKAFAEGNPAIPDPSWWDRALPIKDLPNTASYMAEATPLLGLSSAVSALMDWERRGPSFMRDMANAVSAIPVPNSVTAAMKTQYEHIPELEGKTTADTFKNIWNYKTHQLDGNHPSKVGLLGEKIERTPANSNPWIYHLLNPVDWRSPEKKRTYQFIEKLYRKTGDTEVIPGHPTERFTDPRTNEQYKLDPANLALLQEHVGKGRQFAIKESGLTMDQVKDLSNEEIVYFMRKLYRIGREIGVSNFIEDERVDLSKADPVAQPRGFTEAASGE